METRMQHARFSYNPSEMPRGFLHQVPLAGFSGVTV